MLQFSFYLGLVSEVLVTSSGAKWGHVVLYCLCRERIQLALGRTPKDLIAGRIAVLFPYPIVAECIGHMDCHFEKGNGTLASGIALNPALWISFQQQEGGRRFTTCAPLLVWRSIFLATA